MAGRRIIVTCDDLDCKFKQKGRGSCKIDGECTLDTSDAIEFLSKYKYTTCEIGMGEETITNDEVQDNLIICKLKYRGKL